MLLEGYSVFHLRCHKPSDSGRFEHVCPSRNSCCDSCVIHNRNIGRQSRIVGRVPFVIFPSTKFRSNIANPRKATAGYGNSRIFYYFQLSLVQRL